MKKSKNKEKEEVVRAVDELSDKKRSDYIAENKKKKKEKVKKGNIFKRIKRYFVGVGKEVSRIRWTSGKELVKYSIASVILILFFGLYFYGINWIALLIRSMAK